MNVALHQRHLCSRTELVLVRIHTGGCPGRTILQAPDWRSGVPTPMRSPDEKIMHPKHCDAAETRDMAAWAVWSRLG